MCTIRLSAVAVLVVVLRAQTPDDSFRFALTGDSIIERLLSVYDEPAYLRMFDRIRSADATFTNFEMLVHNFEFAGAPVSGGTYMGAPPWVIDELKWAGFRMFGIANNCNDSRSSLPMLSRVFPASFSDSFRVG